MKKLWSFLLGVIYPGRCPVCDDVVMPWGGMVCSACYRKLSFIKQPVCLKCGKELRKEEKEYCGDCMRRNHVFTQGRAVFPYGEIAESLYRFKYAGRQEYAEFYAHQAVLLLGDVIRAWKVDAILPVPIHISRFRKRGYNQATLLAKGIGKTLGIPVKDHLIRRVKKTVPMKFLGASERQINLKKAFHIRRNDVELKRVLIVDDIYTTGSTMDALAGELRLHGVEDVFFVTVAIGEGV